MNARVGIDLVGVVAVAVIALGGCERARPVDPDAEALTILAECGADSACVHERWRRDPRAWSLGLRAEVAGRGPRGPLIVETTRDIIIPELRAAACLGDVAKATGVYYRSSVSGKGSGEFPLVLFHWKGFDQAAAGHRQVVAAVADARGDEEQLWRMVERDPSLEQACMRFRGKVDRCQVAGAVD